LKTAILTYIKIQRTIHDQSKLALWNGVEGLVEQYQDVLEGYRARLRRSKF